MATPPAKGHQRLAAKVCGAVRADILSGALAPDAQLSEADLSERLGVSRTPVREAQFIRESLECALIIDAARLAGESAVRRPRANLVDQEEAVADNDRERFFLLDEALLATLAEASGHATAWRMVQQRKTHMGRIRQLSFRMPHHMAKLTRQHSDIVDAVARGDAAAAQIALSGHLREIFATIGKLGLAKWGPQQSGDRQP